MKTMGDTSHIQRQKHAAGRGGGGGGCMEHGSDLEEVGCFCLQRGVTAAAELDHGGDSASSNDFCLKDLLVRANEV